jgi:PKD repeat protein
VNGPPVAQTEHIYIFLGYRWGAVIYKKAELEALLQSMGAYRDGSLWRYNNQALNKTFVIHFAEDQASMKTALETEGAHVIFLGHANYGLGPVFATSGELSSQKIWNIYYIDDTRIFNVSSPWIGVNVHEIRTDHTYPNWWPEFQDGTQGIMPYDFGDPLGDPPYNYYITYRIPGDPNLYMVESADFGAIERFSDSGKAAWFSPDGRTPDPTNLDERRYFITNPTAWEPSLNVIGNWNPSWDGSQFFGENYFYRPAGAGQNWVEWLFSITQPGLYRVLGWWPAFSTNTGSARYTVNHSGGSSTFFVDQRANGGRWNQIGEFSLTPGNYSVVLTDQASSGQVIADGLRVVSSLNPPPVLQADFRATSRYGTAPLEVNFRSQSTGEGITSLRWQFGDGYTETTTSGSVSHTYTSPGTYTVQLTVYSPDGSSTRTKTGYIVVGDVSSVLRAEFSASPQAGTIPFEVAFADRSSGEIVSWAWDFDNDGIIDSAERNPRIIFDEPGNYTVRLTVTDANGIASTEQKTNFIVAEVYDNAMDNIDYPKSHYRSKTIVFRKDLEVAKENLRYSRLFYESCNTGDYFLDTFNRGKVFFTLSDSSALGFNAYLQAYLEGKSDREIWTIMQGYDSVYDYYDFNKLPSQQQTE